MSFPVAKLLTCCMDLIFRNLFFLPTLDFTYSNASKFQHSSIPGTYALGAMRTPNQTDGDVTFYRWCDHEKITKKIET